MFDVKSLIYSRLPFRLSLPSLMSIKLSNLKPAAIFPVLNVRESYVSLMLVDEVPKSVYSEN